MDLLFYVSTKVRHPVLDTGSINLMLTNRKNRKRKMNQQQQKTYYIYILASKKNGTLYIGLTNDLVKRVCEHKERVVKGFTEKYHVNQLVYYEIHSSSYEAVSRERQMKKWNREWKIKLVEKTNPDWNDLYLSII
jgi:putative endonuclease